MNRVLFAICFLLGSSAAIAEQKIKDLSTLRNDMTQAYEELIDGAEVPIRGALGTFITDSLTFVDETGSYDVKLDAGREARRSLEGCQVNPFDWNDSDCLVSGRAEISVDFSSSTLADGYELDLIIFEVEITKRRK